MSNKLPVCIVLTTRCGCSAKVNMPSMRASGNDLPKYVLRYTVGSATDVQQNDSALELHFANRIGELRSLMDGVAVSGVRVFTLDKHFEHRYIDGSSVLVAAYHEALCEETHLPNNAYPLSDICSLTDESKLSVSDDTWRDFAMHIWDDAKHHIGIYINAMQQYWYIVRQSGVLDTQFAPRCIDNPNRRVSTMLEFCALGVPDIARFIPQDHDDGKNQQVVVSTTLARMLEECARNKTELHEAARLYVDHFAKHPNDWIQFEQVYKMMRNAGVVSFVEDTRRSPASEIADNITRFGTKRPPHPN